MNPCDIVFIGQVGIGEIFPFNAPSFTEPGSPVVFSALAAAYADKRIGVITKIPKTEENLLDPLREAKIDIFVNPGQIYKYHAVFPTANVDQRQIFRIQVGEPFLIDEIPFLETSLIHLCTIGVRKFHLDLMNGLKERGFHLSVDMQSFLNQADPMTGTGRAFLEDVPEKKEIVKMADFVKCDVVEGKILTGSDVMEEQAEILEDWGSVETIVTSSTGIMSRSRGKTTFVEFTNRRTEGRMGRGDTVMGAYLSYRMDHSAQESVLFAAALTSIKLESPGPFSGTIEDVLERVREISTCARQS